MKYIQSSKTSDLSKLNQIQQKDEMKRHQHDDEFLKSNKYDKKHETVKSPNHHSKRKKLTIPTSKVES